MDRNRISQIYHRLNSLDHYEVLGVERRAGINALRNAYYQQCRKWHPDQFVMHNLDAIQLEQIETIFSVITRAYHSLRAAVANKHPHNEILSMGEDGVESHERVDGWGLGGRSVRGNTVRGNTVRGNTVREDVVSEDAVRNAEASLRARLRELMSHARSEKRVNEQRAQVYFEQGQRALVEYDFRRAVECFESALHLAPYNGMYRECYQLAIQQRRAVPQPRQPRIQRPRFAPPDEQRRVREAIRHYRDRIQAGDQDGQLFARLGHLLRWFDGELTEASQCLQKAILLEPDNAEYRVSLAELYAEQRQHLRAMREFYAALGLARDAHTRTRAERGLAQLRN